MFGTFTQKFPRDYTAAYTSMPISYYTYIKNNNKHFHFSDKRNINIKLIQCDVTLQHSSK